MRETEPGALLLGNSVQQGPDVEEETHSSHVQSPRPSPMDKLGGKQTRLRPPLSHPETQAFPLLANDPDENSRLPSMDWRGCLSSWKQDRLPRKLIKTQRSYFFYCLFLEKKLKGRETRLSPLNNTGRTVALFPH